MPQQMADALMGLAYQREFRELSAEEIAGEVSQGKELDLDGESRTRLCAYVEEILKLDSLAVAAKAADLGTEFERVLADSRVITDIRPVYIDHNHENITGMMVVTSLKIDSFESGSYTSRYFGVSESDLLELKKNVDWAISKIQSLKTLISETDAPLIELGDDT